jgi:glutamine amidotransferase
MSAATKATIVDAGVGNLGNLERALRHVGAEVELTRDPDVVAASRCLLLPGVGAFRPPRESLRGDLEQALHSALDAGAWLLGICIGYQLLFETSDEFGETDGLALLPGKVNRLPEGVALPHIGWNRVHAAASAQGDAVHPLLAGIAEASYFYFVHSYAPFQVPQDVRLAETLHGTRFVAVAGRGRVLGTQFHPEKSGPTGLRLLSNYLELCHGSDPSH